METFFRINTNGKPMAKLYKDNSSTIFSKNNILFHYSRANMFINEFKTNSLIKQQRSFAITIRLDGNYKNSGEYKMSQMEFTEEELIKLRNNIDRILNCKI